MSETLDRLWATIESRKVDPPPGSYTASLFAAGEIEMAKKVGEEAIEVIVAAQREGPERIASEAADLVYHLMVLLAAHNVPWANVETELARRAR